MKSTEFDRPRAIYRDENRKMVIGYVSEIQFENGLNVSLWESGKENPIQLYFGHDQIGFNVFLDRHIMEITNIHGNRVDLHENPELIPGVVEG